MSVETQIIQALGGILSVAATTGIGIITPKIKAFLNAHTTAKTAAVASDALDQLTKVVESVVADFNQRIVSDAKTKQAFSQDLAEQTKKDAMAAVKDQGNPFIGLLGKSGNDLESLVSTLIEQAVAKAKGNK